MEPYGMLDARGKAICKGVGSRSTPKLERTSRNGITPMQKTIARAPIHLMTLLVLAPLIGVMPAAWAQEEVIYYHTDALGTPVAITDQSGNVIERREFEPYGHQLQPATLADGPGYTGHVSDAATGLSYMQQRYYDPKIGRFLSVDPVTANSVGGNFNRYWYANNNPYRFTDPDGRQSRDFESISKQAETYLKTPPPSDKDWLGPAIGVALTGMLAAPVAAEGGMYMFANPGTVATATNVAAEATGVTGTAAGAGLLAREAAGVLKPAGKLIGQAGSSSQVRLLQGGQAEAGQLFQQLSKGGETVKGTNYPGALMRIGEEATVGLRPTSKSGPPTIDVNIPGLNIREIKFIDNAVN